MRGSQFSVQAFGCTFGARGCLDCNEGVRTLALSRAGLWALIPLTALSMPPFFFGVWGWLITAAARAWVTVRVKGPLRPWTQGGSRSSR